MGTATDFRSPSLSETKHSGERKSDGSPHFFPELKRRDFLAVLP